MFLMSEKEARKINSFLKNNVKPNQMIWTNLPEILEWEGDRLCGWLPKRIQYLYEINKKIPVDAIFLTNLRSPYPMEEEWSSLLFGKSSLPQYRTVMVYQESQVFAKLLIRDNRE